MDYTNDERFDGLYLQVAGTARGIEPMLDTVFSFLRRKTDFFHGPPGTEAGGNDGTAAAVRKVNEVLQKHINIYNKAEEKKKAKAKKQQEEQKRKKQATAAKKKKDESVMASKNEGGSPSADEDEVIEIGTDGFDISSKATSTCSKTKISEKSKSAPKLEPKSTASNNDTTKEDEAEDGPAPVGNGGKVEGKYVWTQTLIELNVTIPLPENTRGRDLNVTFGKKHLKVGFKKDPGNYLVNAPLTKKIILDDSFWTVEDGNRLVLNLQKVNQMEWWDAVCVGDPIIDVKKVQPENSKLDDLDGETRQTVEKMMFDQRQKALGLPTSEEQKKNDMLQKFMKSHPEMDFSNAKIS